MLLYLVWFLFSYTYSLDTTASIRATWIPTQFFNSLTNDSFYQFAQLGMQKVYIDGMLINLIMLYLYCILIMNTFYFLKKYGIQEKYILNQIQ